MVRNLCGNTLFGRIQARPVLNRITMFCPVKLSGRRKPVLLCNLKLFMSGWGEGRPFIT